MSSEFVYPNWHVVLLHFPIALTGMGLLIQLLAGRSTSSLRRSGRWMIVLGALMALPAATSGVYALRDVMSPGPIDLAEPWHVVSERSTWTPVQWELIEHHIWYNAGGTALLLLVAFGYLVAGCSATRRGNALRLLAGLVAVGLMYIGAWHGGSAVFRHGTSVAPPAALHMEPLVESPTAPLAEPSLSRVIDPLQAHILVAGFVVASIIAAMAMTLRRPVLATVVVREDVAIDPDGEPVARRADVAVSCPPRHVTAARSWLLVTLLGLVTAALGIWSAAGGFGGDELERVYSESRAPGRERLLWHAALGVSIVAAPLIIALLARYAPRTRGLAGFPGFLLILVALGQVWLGITLLFDTRDGPLTEFNKSGGFTPATTIAPAPTTSPTTQPVFLD